LSRYNSGWFCHIRGRCAPGKKGGKGEDADAWGRRGRERKEGERAHGRGGKWRRHAGPGGSERKREESVRGAGLAAGPGAAHVGRGRRERGVGCWGEGRPKGKRGKESRPG
jgi:hypothetical protein